MLTSTSYLGKNKHENPHFSFSPIKTIPSRFSGNNVAFFDLIISDSTEKARFRSAEFCMLLLYLEKLSPKLDSATQEKILTKQISTNQLCVFHVCLAIIQWSLYALTLLTKKINGLFK